MQHTASEFRGNRNGPGSLGPVLAAMHRSVVGERDARRRIEWTGGRGGTGGRVRNRRQRRHSDGSVAGMTLAATRGKLSSPVRAGTATGGSGGREAPLAELDRHGSGGAATGGHLGRQRASERHDRNGWQRRQRRHRDGRQSGRAARAASAAKAAAEHPARRAERGSRAARARPGRATSTNPPTRPASRPTARFARSTEHTGAPSTRSGALRTRPPRTSRL